MSKLTKRGWVVLVILPTIALIALLMWVSARVWYVEGVGYCIGTMASCFH
jgi:hypothetical protein